MHAPTPTPRSSTRRRPHRFSRRTRHELARILLVVGVALLAALLLFLGNFLDSLP